VAVWQLPGGGTASNTVGNLLTIIFLGGMLFFAFRVYMEQRTNLFTLSDGLRATLYGSLALAVLAIVATSRLWDEGGLGVLAWFALIGAATYGLFVVWRASREY